MLEQELREQSIEDLIFCLIAGEDPSWRMFLRRIGPIIRGQCIQAGLNTDDVNDIAQLFALKLLEKNCVILRTLEIKGADSFYGWVKVVISRLVVDYIRNRGLKDDREEESGMSYWRNIEYPSRVNDWLDNKLVLEKASGELNLGEKLLFWLEYSDLENSEVALILGVTITAVQQRLTRLRKKLRGILEGKR
ncbi:sigma-70 family RNA polymerase sigma factor [bacterium]|nr:sigma-70 family RNA polymerase sigma factor [bacterium]